MNRTVPGRLDQLPDTRTWTVAARLELLYQIGVVEADLLGLLTVARRARNTLAHTGRHPAESDATAAYSSALALLQLATSGSAIPLMHLDLSDHTLSDPFLPPPPMKIDPVYWMEIPKLPGEAELERLEAAVRHNDSQE